LKCQFESTTRYCRNQALCLCRNQALCLCRNQALCLCRNQARCLCRNQALCLCGDATCTPPRGPHVMHRTSARCTSGVKDPGVESDGNVAYPIECSGGAAACLTSLPLSSAVDTNTGPLPDSSRTVAAPHASCLRSKSKCDHIRRNWRRQAPCLCFGPLVPIAI
jgi:hypothetical protein